MMSFQVETSSRVLSDSDRLEESRIIQNSKKFFRALMLKSYDECVRVLKKGVSSGHKDEEGNTFLHAACASGDRLKLELVSDLELDQNSTNSTGQTAIMLAVGAKSQNFFLPLAAGRPRLDAKDKNFNGLGHYALHFSNQVLFEFLVALGDFRFDEANRFGLFPLDVCESLEFSQRSAAILKGAGLDFSHVRPLGRNQERLTSGFDRLCEQLALRNRVRAPRYFANKTDSFITDRFLDEYFRPALTPQFRKKISLRQIEVKSVLGKGGFGTVWRVAFEGRSFALKVLDRVLVKRKRVKEYLKNERDITRNCYFPFIIHSSLTLKDKNFYLLFLELCPFGDLGRISKILPDRLSRANLQAIMAELLLTIEYLRSQKFIHRDIKPGNILIADDGHIRLIDFGLCKRASKLTDTICGTLYFKAPEIVGRRQYSNAVDLYAFGLTLYQLISGKTPFHDRDREIVEDKILCRELDFDSRFRKQDRDLIFSLIEANPEARLGFNDTKEIRNHPFFEGVDWEKVKAGQVRPFSEEELKILGSDLKEFEIRERSGEARHRRQVEAKLIRKDFLEW